MGRAEKEPSGPLGAAWDDRAPELTPSARRLEITRREMRALRTGGRVNTAGDARNVVSLRLRTVARILTTPRPAVSNLFDRGSQCLDGDCERPQYVCLLVPVGAGGRLSRRLPVRPSGLSFGLNLGKRRLGVRLTRLGVRLVDPGRGKRCVRQGPAGLSVALRLHCQRSQLLGPEGLRLLLLSLERGLSLLLALLDTPGRGLSLLLTLLEQRDQLRRAVAASYNEDRGEDEHPTAADRGDDERPPRPAPPAVLLAPPTILPRGCGVPIWTHVSGRRARRPATLSIS